MAEIIPFPKPKASARHAGKTLCRAGFHQWRIDKNQVFDVKRGLLVTVYRCARCGAVKNESR